MARNKKVEILSNEQEVLHPMTDGDCVIFEDGQTLTQKLSEDDSVKYTPEIVNSSPMFKVGEGNTVDYSDNVLDGAYERATLQGQTYVNYIQESSADEVTLPTPFTEYERTQHNTLTSDEEGTLGINLVGQSYVNALQHDSEEEYVVLGESLEFQEKKVEYTNEGQIKSAMLKGQTLVNLWSNSGQHSIAPKSWIEQVGDCFKKSTKYLLKYNVLQTNTNNSMIVQYYQNGTWVVNEPIHAKLNEDYYILTTPSADFNKIRIFYNSTFGTETVILEDIMLLEYQEGMENWDIPYFEGMQSVTVSTKLENKLGTYSKTASIANTGMTFTTTSAATRTLAILGASDASTNPLNFKPNTKYLIYFKISNLVLDGLSEISLAFSVSTLSSGNCLFVGEDGTSNSQVSIASNGIYRIVRTTTDLITSSTMVIKGHDTQWENSGSTLRSLTISEVMCIEYQNGMENWDLPYFEDYQVMKPVQVESVNKNLLEVPNISTTTRRGIKIETNEGVFKFTGTSNSSGGRNDLFENDRHLLTLNLKKGKTYTMSIIDLVENGSAIDGFFITDNKTGAALFGCNSENKFIHTYTPLIDMDVHFGMNVLANETYNSTFKVLIEESSTTTEYVPHQSKTTYSWDEVILRKIGNVQDTLDLTTGEWVQRIGEVQYSDFGPVSFAMIDGAYSTVILRPEENLNKQNSSTLNLLCDKVGTTSGATMVAGIYENPLNAVIYDKAVTSEDEFRQKYQNCKVQYVLETPIIHYHLTLLYLHVVLIVLCYY